ncbi:MAG TPA: hypothetical protein VFI06_17045, partial [Chitinophagaceae bacterium]|nr:hypothetical protein [Chitinophagaceae bacterium]
MKLVRSLMLLFCAASLLTSCGNNNSGEQSTTDTTKTTDTSGTQTTTVEKNTIVTTPQTMVSATHKVADYDKWQASYDGHDSMRLAAGLHSYVIARGFKDPNMVMVVLKADDLEKAKAFTKDPSLKKAMQKGGVTGAPTITFMTAVWQDTSTLAPNVLRSRTTFTVKDWDAWLKNFQEGKQ